MFNRSIVLYAVAYVLLLGLINNARVDVRILNYLRDSAQYVNKFAEEGGEFDRIKFLEASDYYEKLTQTGANITLGYGMLGYIHHQLGNTHKAVAFYKKALKYHSSFFGFYYNLGVIYLEQNKWPQAMEMFKEATAIGLEPSLAYYVLASEKRFDDINKRESWIRQEQQKLKRQYDYAMKYVMYLYAKLHDYESLYFIATRRIRDKQNVSYFDHYYAGIAAFKLNQLNQAAYHFDQSIALKKDYKDAYKQLSLVFEKIGNVQAAEALKRKAETLKDSVEEKPSLVYYIPLVELH